MHRKQNKNGFTLVELIIVIAAFAAFSAVTVGVIQSVMSARINSERLLVSQISLRGALLEVTKEIRSRSETDEPDLANITERFILDGSDLTGKDGGIVAQRIEEFEIVPLAGNESVRVTVRAGGQSAETIINLRNR